MSAYNGFIGPAYSLDALSADSQECVNLYPEKVESETGKSKWILKGTPGLQFWRDGNDFVYPTHTGPVRALLQTDTALYYVIGSKFYSMLPGGSKNYIGDVGTDAGNSPAFIHANGTQILIVSAGATYYYDGTTVTAVSFPSVSGTVNTTGLSVSSRIDWVSGDKFEQGWTGKFITIGSTEYRVLSVESDVRMFCTGPFTTSAGVSYSISFPTTALTSCYINGFSLIHPPDSNNVYFCEPYRMETWDPLSVFVKEGYGDHITRIFSDGQYVWLFGNETTEVWANVPDGDEPFQRLPGGFLQIGCAARWAVNALSGGVAFIGRDSRGFATAYLTQGLRPQRISTHAIETAWAGYSDVSDAYAYTYTDAGHEFWVINFGTDNATWVYDVATGAWHRRTYNATDRQLQNTHVYWLSQKLRIVGSRTNQKLYLMSEDHLDDAGTAITRVRTAPHIAEENKPVFHSRFTLDMQMGTKTGGGAGSVTLNYSDNGGQSWSSNKTVSTGAASAWTTRAIWRRLGRSRDRVYKVTISDAQKVTLIAAHLEVTPGFA